MLEDVPDEFLLLGIYPAHLGLDATTLVLVAAFVALVVSAGVGIASTVVWRRGRGVCVSNTRFLCGCRIRIRIWSMGLKRENG